MLSKVKDFVVKNWQWLITTIVAIVFYIIGRSKDTKDEEVKLANISKVLEEKKTQEVLKGWVEAEEEKNESLAENLLIFGIWSVVKLCRKIGLDAPEEEPSKVYRYQPTNPRGNKYRSATVLTPPHFRETLQGSFSAEM